MKARGRALTFELLPVAEFEGGAVDEQQVRDNQRHSVRPARIRIQLRGISVKGPRPGATKTPFYQAK